MDYHGSISDNIMTCVSYLEVHGSNFSSLKREKEKDERKQISFPTGKKIHTSLFYFPTEKKTIFSFTVEGISYGSCKMMVDMIIHN